MTGAQLGGDCERAAWTGESRTFLRAQIYMGHGKALARRKHVYGPCGRWAPSRVLVCQTVSGALWMRRRALQLRARSRCGVVAAEHIARPSTESLLPGQSAPPPRAARADWALEPALK